MRSETLNNVARKRAPLANTIDGYLAAVPPDASAALAKLRQTIKSVAPDAAECISYQIPSFNHCGLLVGFAAFKNHCSFFVMSTALMRAMKDELKSYDTAKATIHFDVAKPLPSALVKKIVKARLKENERGRRQ